MKRWAKRIGQYRGSIAWVVREENTKCHISRKIRHGIMRNALRGNRLAVFGNSSIECVRGRAGERERERERERKREK